MKLVIATFNVKKAGEMVQILSAALPGTEILTLADFPGAPEPEETGSTYAENSTLKAMSAVQHTGLWCIADDAGLEVDAMDGQPGLHSKRFEGEDTRFDIKMQKILERLDCVPDAERGARFRCCVVIGRPGEDPVVFEDTCEGKIAHAPSGNGGFGYDPIFFLPELGCTMADLTAEQKHAISHRGKVLSRVVAWLTEHAASEQTLRNEF